VILEESCSAHDVVDVTNSVERMQERPERERSSRADAAIDREVQALKAAIDARPTDRRHGGMLATLAAAHHAADRGRISSG
jgi:hypothetical protein